MNNSILGYASVLALTAGAAVIGQSQPTNTPARPPTGIQPATTQPGTPGRDSDAQTRWRETADEFNRMNQSMGDRNQELARKLAQAQTQTGDARLNGITEVLTGILQEHEHMSRAITDLQRLAIRGYLDNSGSAQEWDSWKQQYPFLDDSDDAHRNDPSRPDNGETTKDRSKTPTDPSQPRSPR